MGFCTQNQVYVVVTDSATHLTLVFVCLGTDHMIVVNTLVITLRTAIHPYVHHMVHAREQTSVRAGPDTLVTIARIIIVMVQQTLVHPFVVVMVHVQISIPVYVILDIMVVNANTILVMEWTAKTQQCAVVVVLVTLQILVYVRMGTMVNNARHGTAQVSSIIAR